MVCGLGSFSGISLPENHGSENYRTNIDGIDVIVIPLAYSNNESLMGRARLFLRYVVRSIPIALTESYDLIFATSTPLTAALPGIFAKLFRRKIFLFEVRDLWPELPKALGMKNVFLLGGMSLLEWCAYRTSDKGVGLSPGIVEGIRRRSAPDHPVVMIPNGCDLDVFHPGLRKDLHLAGINRGDFVAGFTGAHGPANGLNALIDVASELKRRGASHIKLAFIGDGKEKALLQKRAVAEGLDNCLFFPPVPKHELSSVTASLDCGLMILKNVPAFYYGTSPNKFFDYISSGIPVINNYPGWLAELIKENDCGKVVPPDDACAFADALEKLAADKEECQRMGRNSRALAENTFDRSLLANQFVAEIEKYRA